MESNMMASMPYQTGNAFKLHLSLLLLVVYILHEVNSADPVLTPQTLTDDYNNTANPSSVIKWGAIPENLTVRYKQSGLDYHHGNLGAFYSMVHSFLDTIIYGDPPYEAILKAKDGDYQIIELVQWVLGFILCLLGGLLFIFVMPIVGCCWCCCRCCCSNCGAHWKPEYNENHHYNRLCLMTSLLLTICLILCGVTMVFLANDSLGKSIEDVGPNVNDSITDFKNYLDNIVKELQYVTLDNFGFVSNVIIRDLDNIDYITGIGVRDDVGSGGAIQALTDLSNFETTFDKYSAVVLNINKEKALLTSELTALESDIATVKSDLAAAKSQAGCQTSCSALSTAHLDTLIKPSLLPGTNTQLSEMTLATITDYGTNVQLGKKKFDDIPKTVKTDSAKNVKAIKAELVMFNKTISEAVEKFESFPGQASGLFDSIDKFINMISNTQDQAGSTYKSFYGALALTFIFLVILMMVSAAWLCACCSGYQEDQPPDKRSSTSNHAGNTLLCSGCCIFSFSWALMMIVTILFVEGAVAYKLICEPLTDPKFTMLKELIDGPNGIIGDGYLVGKLLLGDKDKNLTVSGILEGCKDNKAAYTTLMLESKFSLASASNYKKDIDVSSSIGDIKVDLSGQDVIATATEYQLGKFDSGTKIDFDGFIKELSKSTLVGTPTGVSTTIRNAANDGTNTGNAKAQLLSIANKLDTISVGSYKVADSRREKMLSDIKDMNDSVSNNMSGVINDMILRANVGEKYIKDNAASIVKKHVTNFVNRLFFVLDSYVNHVTNLVENEVGRCKPLYNVYDTIIVKSLCSRITDDLNGVWFGLGWSVFFLTFCLIFSIRLSKYLVRMKPYPTNKPAMPSMIYVPQKERVNLPPKQSDSRYRKGSRNRVAPSDI